VVVTGVVVDKFAGSVSPCETAVELKATPFLCQFHAVTVPLHDPVTVMGPPPLASVPLEGVRVIEQPVGATPPPVPGTANVVLISVAHEAPLHAVA